MLQLRESFLGLIELLSALRPQIIVILISGIVAEPALRRSGSLCRQPRQQGGAPLRPAGVRTSHEVVALVRAQHRLAASRRLTLPDYPGQHLPLRAVPEARLEGKLRSVSWIDPDFVWYVVCRDQLFGGFASAA
jgi:hypothetical protein